ncbi:Fic/DOC family protein [Gordonia paraffinivorans]|uniref:Fic/DOC family protein n=1 Tax=Gordonia paraffinivorans TaxID=175628 RepID=UPI003FCC7756
MVADDRGAKEVLENLLGLTDADELQRYERRAAALRVAQLEEHPDLIVGDFDFPHLQALHAYILQDVYPWAGEPRRYGQETTAMGMPHCRAEFLDAEIDRVFTAIDRHRPSPDDRDAAIVTVADHWGELTGVHPFRDGNSRSQRLFFDRYLRESGWALDWSQVDATAVHAARHVAMATVDSSYLAATLRPGIRRLGEVPAGTLTATQGTRDAGRSVEIFHAMLNHKRQGGTAATFTLNDAQPETETPAQRAARIATRGVSRQTPTTTSAAATPTTQQRPTAWHRSTSQGRGR